MELPPQDEADLFSYVLAEKSDTRCPIECLNRIPDIIRRANQRLSITVYRGQKNMQTTIDFDEGRKKFISTSLDSRGAVNFTDTTEESNFSRLKKAKCCLFTIHLKRVLALRLMDVSFKRAKSGELYHLLSIVKNPQTSNRNDLFSEYITGEEEVLVLGGGTFYKDKQTTNPGFLETNRGHFETWYVDQSAPKDDSIVWEEWVNSNKGKNVVLKLNDKPGVETRINAKPHTIYKLKATFQIDELTRTKLIKLGYEEAPNNYPSYSNILLVERPDHAYLIKNYVDTINIPLKFLYQNRVIVGDRKLNVVLDIDNTLVEFILKNDGKWDGLPEAERSKYKFKDGFVLRPHFHTFFKTLKGLVKSVNLWTWSDVEYGNTVAKMITAETGCPIQNVWGDVDAEASGEKTGNGKDLNYLWYTKKIFQPCDTIIVDDLPSNSANPSNYQNGILVKPFALWGRVKKNQPYGPYQDLSEDDTLLKVLEELKKIENDKNVCSDENEERPPLEDAIRINESGGRRRRKITRRALRRYGTKRRS